VTGMKLTKGIPAWIPRWPGDPWQLTQDAHRLFRRETCMF
jgi:hypothetical protein